MSANSTTTNNDKYDSSEISSSHHDSNVTNGFHKKMANENESTDASQKTIPNGLLKKVQEAQENLGQINNIISEVNDILQSIETNPEENVDNGEKYRDKKHSNKEGALPDKEFLQRNSLLTDLFKITHLRTVYNLFMVTFLLLFMYTVSYDITERGTIQVGTVTIRKGFAKFPICFHIWLLMQASTIGVYVAFNIWAYRRLGFLPKSLNKKVWDYSWLTIFIVYQLSFIILSTKAMLDEELSIACSFIILLEQTRMVMKSHAFVRSMAPKFLSYKPHSEIPRPNNCGLSHYLYFLFVPTLVYRDIYPRTKHIRWMVVIKHFAEVGIIIFYQAFIVERFIIPVFNVFGTRDLEQKWYIKSILEASIPGILIFISGNYLLLHAWLNAWGEMLRFADRLFYKDWWNCTTYHAYHRTWNVVVHDWLYTYIYKDMYEIITPRNRTLSMSAVFFASAIFHEYILAFALRFCYPVMFVLFFGLGFTLTLAGKFAKSNIFMWLSFCIGNGIMFSMYSIEYFARVNCAPYSNYYVDLLLPRSWNCQRLNV